MQRELVWIDVTTMLDPKRRLRGTYLPPRRTVYGNVRMAEMPPLLPQHFLATDDVWREEFKDQLEAAEVPRDCNVPIEFLRVVRVRPSFEPRARLLIVDVRRLRVPAPGAAA